VARKYFRPSNPVAGQKSKLGNAQFENCFDNFSASGLTNGA
jgi:hypothetical protein